MKTKTKLFAVLIGLAILAGIVLGFYIALLQVFNQVLAVGEILLEYEISHLQITDDNSERSEIVWKIYGLESTWGKNDSCKLEGKFNGYGFGQNSNSWRCYNTFEEVTHEVHNWVQDKLDRNFTIGQLVCFYNTGRSLNDCPYYQKYLSL